MIPLWRNLAWVFLSLIIYLAPQFLKSQTKIISGNIRDGKSGEPLSYATIQIKSTYKGTISNVDGYFTLLGLKHDTLTVVSKYLGYQTLETFIDLNNATTINIEMHPVISELEGITIYAESFQIWAEVSEEELRQLEYAEEFDYPVGLPSWEYEVVKLRSDDEFGGLIYTSELLNLMGDKGWELVDIVSLDDKENSRYGIFKRSWEAGYEYYDYEVDYYDFDDEE